LEEFTEVSLFVLESVTTRCDISESSFYGCLQYPQIINTWYYFKNLKKIAINVLVGLVNYPYLLTASVNLVLRECAS